MWLHFSNYPSCAHFTNSGSCYRLALWDGHWEMKCLFLWPLVFSPNSAQFSFPGNKAKLEEGLYLLLLLWLNTAKSFSPMLNQMLKLIFFLSVHKYCMSVLCKPHLLTYSQRFLQRGSGKIACKIIYRKLMWKMNIGQIPVCVFTQGTLITLWLSWSITTKHKMWVSQPM